MIPPLRSFDDVDGKERGKKKTDDLRAMTALGPRTLLCRRPMYLLRPMSGFECIPDFRIKGFENRQFFQRPTRFCEIFLRRSRHFLAFQLGYDLLI